MRRAASPWPWRAIEDVALHLEDTVNAGDGLVYRPAAQALVAEGPVRVAELIEWGANFDTEAGELLRTREGAHSLARILHANGDATGAEISRSLAAFARVHKRIRFAEWTTVTGLVVADGRVIGADLLGCDRRPRLQQRISARAVLVAAGGAGQVYSDTTNPAVATGDGIALAAQAGAAARRHGVLPVPSHRALAHRRAALPAVRGAKRRGRNPAQRPRRALHGALSSAARAGSPRRGGPRHRPRGHGRDPR